MQLYICDEKQRKRRNQIHVQCCHADIQTSTQTDLATVAVPFTNLFFLNELSIKRKKNLKGQEYGAVIQILTGIVVKWSYFTFTNVNTNNAMTSLRVHGMSWKQQLVHLTKSLFKHETYFFYCIY